jgi:hypothetical protein
VDQCLVDLLQQGGITFQPNQECGIAQIPTVGDNGAGISAAGTDNVLGGVEVPKQAALSINPNTHLQGGQVVDGF